MAGKKSVYIEQCRAEHFIGAEYGISLKFKAH
jgi:hypothetical protein